VGTAGDMTLLLLKVGPTGYPMLKNGFFSPPNKTAMSVWEDPAQIKFKSWNPLDSAEDFTIYLKGVSKNISTFLRGLFVNYVFVLTITYYITMLFFFKKKYDKKIYYIMTTICLYPLGYLMLYYDGQRYILLCAILLYVLGAYAVNILSLKHEKSKILKYYVPAALCISLLALTLIRVIRDYKLDIVELNEIYATSSEIKKHFDMQNKNIASQDGNWNHTLDLSFFLKARYFGRGKANETNAELRKELLDLDIQYYFVFGKLKNDIDILKPEMQFDSLTEKFTLYKVVHPKT
jgi:Ca2+/Na+ antiporter